METDSAGYLSFTTASPVYGYDNNLPAAHFNRSTSDVNLSVPNEGNVYNSISSRHFNSDQVANNRPRPPPVVRHAGPENTTDVERRTRPWLRITLILVIVVILVVAGCLIALALTCFKDLLCKEVNPTVPPNDTTTVRPEGILECQLIHPCVSQVSRKYGSLWQSCCLFVINNTRTVILQSENDENEIYVFDDHEINRELKGMTIEITKGIGKVKIDFKIEEVNCTTTGLHYVTLTNGTFNETHEVNVTVIPDTQHCPYNRQIVIQTQEYMECQNAQRTDISITFRNDTTELVLANQIPYDFLLVNKFFLIDSLWLEANSDSEPVVRFEFRAVKCSHSGIYFIALGNTTFETVVSVTNYPEKPDITVIYDNLGGLVEGQNGTIQCTAFVGCTKSPPSLFQKVFDEYQQVENVTSDETISNRGINFTVTLGFTGGIDMLTTNGTRYMCNYTSDGEAYQSEVLNALVIPGDYCTNTTESCNRRHPYDCNKFVACSPIRTYERFCGSGLHFVESSCDGYCERPSQANCPLGN